MLLQFDIGMTSEYIKEILKFHFKKSNKGTFSIGGKWEDTFIKKKDGFYILVFDCKYGEEEKFLCKTYDELVEYITCCFRLACFKERT